MEKFVKDSLMNHMESNQLSTNGQHGLRKGRSCITQLIEVMEDWTEHLDNHNSVDAIYLDFQKAFDTVPHHRLFTKLKGYGISGNFLEWIKNFLSERKQKVVLVSIDFWNILVVQQCFWQFLSEILDAFDQVPMTLFLSTFLGVLVLFGYRILLFQVFDQFLVGILECLE
jgi:hypothetical protein